MEKRVATRKLKVSGSFESISYIYHFNLNFDANLLYSCHHLYTTEVAQLWHQPTDWVTMEYIKNFKSYKKI